MTLADKAREAAAKHVCPTDGTECPTSEHQLEMMRLTPIIIEVAKWFAEKALSETTDGMDDAWVEAAIAAAENE